MEIWAWAEVGGVQGEQLILGYFKIFFSPLFEEEELWDRLALVVDGLSEGSQLDVALMPVLPRHPAHLSYPSHRC